MSADVKAAKPLDCVEKRGSKHGKMALLGVGLPVDKFVRPRFDNQTKRGNVLETCQSARTTDSRFSIYPAHREFADDATPWTKAGGETCSSRHQPYT
jgi:hypothetical protein